MASPELQQANELMAQLAEAAMAATGEDGDFITGLRQAMDATIPFEATDAATVVEVSANGVPGEWVTVAESRPGQRMLYVHGGGYVAGSPTTHRRLCEHLARATECEILSLDYRMGPEHPYPAAVDDAIAGLQFVQANGPGGAGAAEIVFVAGDSAGGGLTLATLLAAREHGVAMPAGGVCLSPWTDLVRAIAGSDPPQPEDALARAMAEAYVGDADPADPLISPAYADYTGMPPVLLQVGEPEPLVPDTEVVTERATAAGVDATSEIWPEMPHIWHLFAPILPEGQQAIDRIGEWVRERIPVAAAGD